MGESTSETELSQMARDPKRKAKSNDPGWKYGFLPDLSNKDLVQCSLCGKKMHLGIKRLKQHLADCYGDVLKCPNTTTKILKEMRDALLKFKKNKPIELDGDDGDDNVQESSQQNVSSIAASTPHPLFPSSGTSSKRKKMTFQFPKPQPKQAKIVVSILRKTLKEVVEERHIKKPKQITLENSTRTLADRERDAMHITNFFYECGIPFNAANSRSYEIMVESIGQYGSGLKPPTYHELRVPLLEKAKRETDDLKENHDKAWK